MTEIKCPNCGGPMKKETRIEECRYCGSMIEWYEGPEIPIIPQPVMRGMLAYGTAASFYPSSALYSFSSEQKVGKISLFGHSYDYD